MVAVAGVTLYGGAAAVLLVQGADTVTLGGVRGGSGQWWSSGPQVRAGATRTPSRTCS
jgi:hypothetical protein